MTDWQHAGVRRRASHGAGAWATTVVRVVTGVLFVTFSTRQVHRPHDGVRRLRALRHPVARGRRLPRRHGRAGRRRCCCSSACSPGPRRWCSRATWSCAIATAGRVDGGTFHLGVGPAMLVAMLFLVWAGPGASRSTTASAAALPPATPTALTPASTRRRWRQPTRSRATASHSCVDSAERLLVDALVVAVEHRGVVVVGQPLREQPEAVPDRAGAAVEPVVGAADHERRHQRRALAQRGARARQRVPQRRVDRRRRRRVVVRLDLDRVGEVAERLAQHARWRPRRSGRAACGCRPRARPCRGSRWSWCRRARRSARTSCACTRARGATCRAAARRACRASRRRSSSASVIVGARSPCPSTNWRHASWIWVGGWYSAMRRTTSAAVTSALSVRNGCDPCPGVPCTRDLGPERALLGDQHRQARPVRRRASGTRPTR